MYTYFIFDYYLTNSEKFDKNTFLFHLHKAKEELEQEHPARLRYLFKQHKPPITPNLLITKICKLFNYQPLEPLLVCNINKSIVFDEYFKNYLYNTDEIEHHHITEGKPSFEFSTYDSLGEYIEKDKPVTFEELFYKTLSK